MSDDEGNVPAQGQQAPNPRRHPIQGIKPPQPLVINPDTIASDWKLFEQKWKNYSKITHLNDQEESYKVALLLHTLGDDALRIYNGFHFDTEEDNRTVAEILQKFKDFAVGEENETYERYVFNKRIQADGESFDAFLADLRNLLRSCNYCQNCTPGILRDRIVLGIKDANTQTALLKERNLNLENCISICKAAENANTQCRNLQSAETVNKVSTRPKVQSGPQRVSTPKYYQKPVKKCKFCLKVHVMKKEKCPAYGQFCSVCKGPNHFRGSSVCGRRAGVRAVEQCNFDSDSDVSISSVTVAGVDLDSPIFCKMNVNGRMATFQVDSGATVCVLPRKYVKDLNIRPVAVNLRMWNSTGEKALGKCKVPTVNPATGKRYKIDFVIVEKDLTPLLSRRAAETMNLIKVQYDNLVSATGTTTSASDKTVLDRHPKVFDGDLGLLPGPKVHLTLNQDAEPVIRPARPIPEALKPAVRAELDRLEEAGVIKRVDEPTDWVNQMAVAEKKSGAIRICIDPRPLNLALKREHYRLPVLDDVLPSLSQSDTFSVFDLSQGYLHCELDEESSLLTTFATPFGSRYRYLRLPFGLKVSSEIFQKRLHQALDGLDGIHCVADDVVAHGKGSSNHDAVCDSFLERCEQVGIKLNKDKCQLGLEEITFQGHVITSKGLKPDPDKVRAILDMEPPVDKEGVERLQGTVNYLSRFVPGLSQVMYPISQLAVQGVEWNWGPAQKKAFSELRELLSKAPVLAYFDPKLPLTIQCDASNTGLGAALMQNNQPIAYASRKLRDPETRYAVIEKEMLAIVWSLERWHQFTYGRKVVVYSDHKPLEAITRKPLDRAPKRLQGMLLRALAYDVEVMYCEGKKMQVADTLSRASLPCDSHQESFETVNAMRYLPVTEERAQEVRMETQKDPALVALIPLIKNGWPERHLVPPLVSSYYPVRDELAECDGLVFRGERLVIPQGLRAKIKKEIHLGHTGIDGCLRRAREIVYWPAMSKEIRQLVETCETCRRHEVSQPKETLMPHDIPERPWQKVGVDLMSFKGKDYLITTDYRSNFWEIDFLHVTTTKTVVNKMKAHFARYGVPDTVMSDCGPQFTSEEFRRFSRRWGFKHVTSSPHHHQSNGKVESSVKRAKRMLRDCGLSGEDHYLALLNVRNTPTQGMDTSPAQRFLGRRTQTTLPTSRKLLRPKSQTTVENRQLRASKERQARYYNRHAHDLPPLGHGDVVRVKPFQLGDKTWRKGEVLHRAGTRSYDVATEDGGIYRRNRVHLRHTAESPPVIMTHDSSTQGGADIPRQDPKTPRRNSAVPRSQASPETPELSADAPPAGISPRSPAPAQDASTGYRTRSGRTVKPVVYKDYVYN